MTRPAKYRRVRNDINKTFERRRCPACLRGLFSRDVNIPATHRRCDSCGHVFNLKAEGVRPVTDAEEAKRAPAPSSSEPIAGGEFAIAGTVKIGRGASRWPGARF